MTKLILKHDLLLKHEKCAGSVLAIAGTET